MKVREGQLLKITAPRRTPYKGWCIAEEDFDTDTVETWYPVKNALRIVEGASSEWFYGESLPCRKGIDTISPVTVEDVRHQLEVTNNEILRLLNADRYGNAADIAELRVIANDLERALNVQLEVANDGTR